MQTEPIISLRGLRVAYGANEVLKGIDLAIAPGSFVALLGASGCGKTTLLRTLSGFTPASAGSISVKGRDILGEPPERRGMAMVFQSYALWSHMNVAQNIGYGLKLRRVTRDEIRQRVSNLLNMLGLDGFGERSVNEHRRHLVHHATGAGGGGGRSGRGALRPGVACRSWCVAAVRALHYIDASTPLMTKPDRALPFWLPWLSRLVTRLGVAKSTGLLTVVATLSAVAISQLAITLVGRGDRGLATLFSIVCGLLITPVVS